MSLKTEYFDEGASSYKVQEAPMSFILPLVEADRHGEILPEVMKAYTFKRDETGEYRPLGEALLDEFGMTGYRALMAVVRELNGLNDDGDEGEPETKDEDEAQAEGNVGTSTR